MLRLVTSQWQYVVNPYPYNEKKLKIRRIYDLVPSIPESRKKRIVYQYIEDKKGKHYEDYANEFEYLTNSGIALEVKAIIVCFCSIRLRQFSMR